MVLVFFVIVVGLLIQIFLWSYKAKNVRLSEQQLLAQPTEEAVFEGVVRRYFRFTWNILQLLADYNSPSHTGGRLVLTNQKLVLYDASGHTVFQLPAATLRIDLIDSLRNTYVWVYADETHRYQIRLLQSRNITKQLEPYRDLEQALTKIRGRGYSNA